MPGSVIDMRWAIPDDVTVERIVDRGDLPTEAVQRLVFPVDVAVELRKAGVVESRLSLAVDPALWSYRVVRGDGADQRVVQAFTRLALCAVNAYTLLVFAKMAASGQPGERCWRIREPGVCWCGNCEERLV